MPHEGCSGELKDPENINCEELHPWDTIEGIDTHGIVRSIEDDIILGPAQELRTFKQLVSHGTWPVWWPSEPWMPPLELPRTRDKRNQKHDLILNQNLWFYFNFNISEKIFLLMSWSKHLKITIATLLWFALWGLHRWDSICTQALGPQEAESSSGFQATSCLNTPRQADLAKTGMPGQCYQAAPGVFLLLVHWEKKSQVPWNIGKTTVFKNQHESGPSQSWPKWAANMAWPWLTRRFFNLTRCFGSYCNIVLGLAFLWRVSDCKSFTCPEPTPTVRPLSVSLVLELVSLFTKV